MKLQQKERISINIFFFTKFNIQQTENVKKIITMLLSQYYCLHSGGISDKQAMSQYTNRILLF